MAFLTAHRSKTVCDTARAMRQQNNEHEVYHIQLVTVDTVL